MESLNYSRISVKKGRMFDKFSKKIIILVVSLLCFCSVGGAELTDKIEQIISRSDQKKALFVVKIIEAESGNTVYEYNAHQAMTPASNMKLVTSAAALQYLGDDYEFTTTVGMLADALVVIGRGDPLLGDEITNARLGRDANWLFDDIVNILKAADINSISDIIIDSTFFDNNRVHSNWPRGQLNRPYACEVSGLNYNGNCVRITARNIGGRVNLQLKPWTAYLNIKNNVKAVSRGSSAIGSFRNSGTNNITVHGKCRRSAGFDVAIERPAVFFGFLLAERLNAAGIVTNGQLIEKHVNPSPAQKVEVLKEYSTPISQVLYRCNKDSFGLAAECLLKTISAQADANKMNGSWQGGRALISEYLNSLAVSDDEFYIDDGSGLSRKNKLSANAIVKILSDMYNSQQWPIFEESLAVGGQDGTVRKYFGDRRYSGKILGKTGYINGVRTFSGICRTDNGAFIFSILTNNSRTSKTRKAINDIVKVVIDAN